MNKIFYFTGTGNSLQIAQDLCEKIGNCSIEKVAEYNGEKIEAERICIVFPVYNWGIPLIIGDFLNKLNIDEQAAVYAVANFGGFPGKALDMVEEILNKKGRKLSGGFLIRMPGNYIIGYGAYKEDAQKKMFKKESIKTDYIAETIINKKVLPVEKSFSLISKLFTNYFYKEVSQFHEKDKNFYVNDSCTGCGLCEKRCPVNNIVLKNGKPEWNHNCELCLSCLQSCPKKAINYGGKTEKRKRYLNPNVKL